MCGYLIKSIWQKNNLEQRMIGSWKNWALHTSVRTRNTAVKRSSECSYSEIFHCHDQASVYTLYSTEKIQNVNSVTVVDWSYLVQTCGCCPTKSKSWRTSSATGPCCYWSRCSVWRIGLWTASSALLLGQARGSGRLESSIWGWLAKGKVWEKRWCCQALGWKVANGANHFWRLLHLPRQRHDDGRFQEDRILTFQGTT